MRSLENFLASLEIVKLSLLLPLPAPDKSWSAARCLASLFFSCVTMAGGLHLRLQKPCLSSCLPPEKFSYFLYRRSAKYFSWIWRELLHFGREISSVVQGQFTDTVSAAIFPFIMTVRLNFFLPSVSEIAISISPIYFPAHLCMLDMPIPCSFPFPLLLTGSPLSFP